MRRRAGRQHARPSGQVATLGDQLVVGPRKHSIGLPQSLPVRIVLQRVTRASVTVEKEIVGAIDQGFLILLGIEPTDTEDDINRAVEKVATLRLFADAGGLMNRSLGDIGGSVLVVSQFTLLADVRKGRRPSFTGAAAPERAGPMVELFVDGLRQEGIHTETGVFGVPMEVELVNDGPVTLVLDVREGRVR